MSVTAKFLADFSSFQQQVDRAVVTANDFKKNILGVDTALKNMGNAFLGDKILREATLAAKAIDGIGGASKLTASEQARVNATVTEAIAKYKALGQEAPANLTALADATKKLEPPLTLAQKAAGLLSTTFGQFTAASLFAGGIQRISSALTGMVSEAIDGAGHIIDLSNKTGLTTTTLQRMQFVAKQTGEELDAFTDSAFKLGVNLSEGNNSVAGALREVGLSLEDIQKQDPSQQFESIVHALGNVKNETDRNRIGVELFGRSFANIASAIGDGYDDIAKHARVSSEAQLKAIDQATDRWQGFIDNIKTGIQTTIGDFLLERDAMMQVTAEAKNLGQELTAAEFEARVLSKTLAQMVPGTPGMFTQGGAGAVIPAPTQNELRAYDDLADSVKKAVEEIKRLNDIRDQAFGLDGIKNVQDMVRAIGGIAGVSHMSAEAQKEFHKALTEATEAAERNGVKVSDQWALIWEATINATGGIEDYIAALAKVPAAAQTGLSTEQVKALVDEWRELNRLQAGGVGVPNLANPDSNSGAAPGARPASTFLQSIGGLFSGKGGTSTAMDVTSSFAGAFEGGGGISGGIQSAATKVLGKVLNFIPVVGPIISAFAGPLVAGVKKLFGGGEGSKTNDERDKSLQDFTGISNLKGAQDQFRELAHEAGVADSAISHVFDTKKTKDFESSFKSVTDQIKQFTDDQAADQERLTAAIQKYGFSIEELGPKLQKQHLADQAKELIEDWRVLVDAGVDVSTVNEKMADTINQFLQTALSVGSEVPAAMRPILQSLADQGKLFDASGNKIEDLQAAGITFSETLTQGFDRVVKKLDELINRLGMAGSALSNLPSSVNVDVNANSGPRNAEDWMPREGYAGGTHGRYVDFGAGRAVTLHGLERVSRPGESDGGGSLATKIDEQTELLRDLPRAIRLAVVNGVALA